MTLLAAARVLAPVVSAALALAGAASASAATCTPLAGERVVAESRTAVVIEGGLEPGRESSGNYGIGSYFACLRSAGRRIRVGEYHGGPLVSTWLAGFQLSGRYLTFVEYMSPGNPGGTGRGVEQYDLTSGTRTFVYRSRRTVRGIVNGGPPLVATPDGNAAWITEEDRYTERNELVWREWVVVHVGSKTETVATYGPVPNQSGLTVSPPLVISGLQITRHTVSWVHAGRRFTKALRKTRARRRGRAA